MTHEIPEEYLSDDFDFGFTSVDQDELHHLMNGEDSAPSSEEIQAIKDKLDLVLEMNSTCEGTTAVKEQYDALMAVKMEEVERAVLPLLINLKKNGAKDYLYWPGAQRVTQCDLQVEKLLRATRG